MDVICPGCSAPIPAEDINVVTDVALCRACGEASPFSSLVHAPQPGAAPATPPGAWSIDDGVELRIGAATRSPMALVFVPFLLVWSGGSLGVIYGSQILSGTFNPAMSAFGLPFLVGSLIFGSLTAMFVCGKVEIRLRGEEGRVFTGIGPLGRSRHFHLSEFTRITEGYVGVRINKRERVSIILDGSRRMTFGAMLNDARRYFLIESLRPLIAALSPRNAERL